LYGQIDYLQDIQPIFNNHCLDCHTGSNGSGALKLNSYEDVMEGNSNNGPIVIPFNADSSLLHLVLLPMPVTVPNEPICCQMPKNADPLSLDQITIIQDWINEGALVSSSLSVNLVPRPYNINLKTYPNPFNNSVRISFSSDNNRQKEIRIYDMMGVLVRSLHFRNIIKGKNYIFWDGKNDLGKTSTSGIYFINLIKGFETLGTQKVLFLK
tara:strand:- start:781 stop:1413 length:633 start_codon:yes stop_codon:yes gene_type:complete